MLQNLAKSDKVTPSICTAFSAYMARDQLRPEENFPGYKSDPVFLDLLLDSSLRPPSSFRNSFALTGVRSIESGSRSVILLTKYL